MGKAAGARTLQVDAAGRQLQARHAAWWDQNDMFYTQVEGVPTQDLWLPLADGTLATEDMLVTPDSLDVERLLGDALTPGPLGTRGDCFATCTPYGKIPWVEAILGCPIRATIKGGSMRTQNYISDLDAWRNRAVRLDQRWLDLFELLIRGLVERSAGRRAVTQPTMRGPADLAEAILGPERMCIAMYDQPAELRAFLDEVTEVFIELVRMQLREFAALDGGYVSAYGIWAPGTTVRTQCDASAILSPAQYAEWILPYDARICEAVDYALIHLHSCSLHTVDALLGVDALRAFEITIETGGPRLPTLPELAAVVRKMIESGRSVILYGPLSADQVQYLLNEVPNGGLAIRARQTDWS